MWSYPKKEDIIADPDQERTDSYGNTIEQTSEFSYHSLAMAPYK